MSAQKKESVFDKEPEEKVEKSAHVKDEKSTLKVVMTKQWLIRGGITLLLLIAVTSGVYYFIQYQKTQELISNPKLSAEKEVERLIEKIGSVMVLPDEIPTVATVEDVNKLKNQTFFASAENGYKVLIYTKAKKAILYDPVAEKIVEVGPINVGSGEVASAASPSATLTLKPVRVAIYNGTTTPRLANTVEKDLKEKAPHVRVVAKGNASKQDYPGTVVSDVTGNNSAEAANIATLLSGEVGKLPTGESATSSAEIVVILGK